MSGTRQSVDLLYGEPRTRIRLSALERALSFAFSAGDTSAIFERALEYATPGPSTFDASSFQHDLFLDELFERCLPMGERRPLSRSGRAYVKGILCAPPDDVATTRLRQDILRELWTTPTLADKFDDVYERASELRSLLEANDAGARYDISQRRIDVLRTLEQVIGLLSAGFGDCTTELRRLSAFGQAVQKTEAYQRLVELLSYEGHFATLDLRVQLGIDGRLRTFQLLDHAENRETRFYKNWFGRWMFAVWMAIRGYRVGQGEVLVRLTDHVFDGLKVEVLQLFQLLGDMEFYRVGLALRRLAKGQGLEATLPTFDETAAFSLSGLYNPFLVADGVRVRPCRIEQNLGRAMTIITGPNSGGKTRLLQAIALSQLLGQAGLPVPAKSANLHWARGMFVSLVEEVSAAQREGRLGTELLRIRRLFERISPGDVIVLDELCSGTNPSEGEEIFRLVIELLSSLEPQLWLTTHFLQFAERLRSEGTISQLSFLQVALDAAEHPTFSFVEGVAKSSLAGQTAERLGVTWKELSALVEDAKRRVQGSLPAPAPSAPTTNHKSDG
jgi:DNA mismatch repair protein MutS2